MFAGESEIDPHICLCISSGRYLYRDHKRHLSYRYIVAHLIFFKHEIINYVLLRRNFPLNEDLAFYLCVVYFDRAFFVILFQPKEYNEEKQHIQYCTIEQALFQSFNCFR